MAKNIRMTRNGKTVSVRVRPVGQAFGVVGEVVARNGRVIATTKTYPHGFDQSARQAAMNLVIFTEAV